MHLYVLFSNAQMQKRFSQLIEEEANGWSYYELQQYIQLRPHLNYYWSHATFHIWFDSTLLGSADRRQRVSNINMKETLQGIPIRAAKTRFQ